MNFEKVLKQVVEFFEGAGCGYAVIGAFALHAYGLTRATQDLDFVTDFEVQQDLVHFLEGLGYETLHLSTGYSNHLHSDPVMGRVDFVYVSGETNRQLFGSTRKLLVLGERSIAVPRAEHLAAMKIQAMKNDPQRTFQEMADILFLLRLPGIDAAEIRGYFEKQGLSDKYDEIKKILETS